MCVESRKIIVSTKVAGLFFPFISSILDVSQCDSVNVIQRGKLTLPCQAEFWALFPVSSSWGLEETLWEFCTDAADVHYLQ